MFNICLLSAMSVDYPKTYRCMRKDLPYKNVRTLIQICYIYVTNLYQFSKNLVTTPQGICKKIAMFWQFSKQSFYLTLRRIFILKMNNYEFVMYCEAQYDENKFLTTLNMFVHSSFFTSH